MIARAVAEVWLWQTPGVLRTGGAGRLALPRWLVGGASIAVAVGVMNVATYGFTMIAARVLGPNDYGAFAGVMATLLVISVLQLGLQATGARRISAEPGHVAQIETSILRVTYRAALGTGLLLLLLSPVVAVVLRLDSLMMAVLIALTAVPLTVMGGQAGILQGERRWAPLALVYLSAGVPRLVIGTALILWQPDELYAVLGVALGQCVPVLVGWAALRGTRAAGIGSDTHSARRVLRETVHNSQALLAFFALSSADIVVARNVLDEREAGLYAGGLILTKAVLFLPQFVVVLAFPAMAAPAERRRALTGSLALVAVSGAVATIAAWLLSSLALVFVGGQEYAALEGRLWAFAVLGTALAMLQLLVYSVLARQGQRSVYLVWGALGALVALGLTTDNVGELLTVVLGVNLMLLAGLVVVSLYLVRSPVAEE